MRPAGLILLTALASTVALAGCSSSSAPADASTDNAKDDAAHRQLCADPNWKAAHLGLWYNVCRAQRL
jgi:outer membrane murein-binding lipoprotein Lpp